MKEVRIKNILKEAPMYGLPETGFFLDEIPVEKKAIRYIRITDIQKEIISDYDPKYLFNIEKKYLLKKGDIVFARSGATVGKTYLFSHNEESTFAGYLIKLSVNKKNNSNFIYYFLNSFDYWKQIYEKQTSSTIQNVNSEILKNLIIKLPSLIQQTAIANYLDHHTTKIDKEISLLEQKVEKLDEYKQALIYETVTKGLDKNVPMKDSGIEWIGMIPEHWKIKPLKKCLKERVKKNKINNTYITNNILSVIKDVGVINYKDKGDVGNKMSDDISNYKLVYPNDIVINKMNVTIGSLGISKEFGALSVVYMVFKETKNNSNKFFNYLFKCKIWQKYLRTMATGILEIRESVDSEIFFSQPLIVPTLEEQNNIICFLDQQCSKIDKKKELVNKKVELLKEYKQSLIYEAVTGKIIIDDVYVSENNISEEIYSDIQSFLSYFQKSFTPSYEIKNKEDLAKIKKELQEKKYGTKN